MFVIRQEIEKTDVKIEKILEAPLDAPDGVSAKVQCEWFRINNSRNHHTYEYDNSTLVLRRGAMFDLELTFEGVEFSRIKKTNLAFTIEINSEGMKSIQSKCSIVDKIDKTIWCMEIIETNLSSSSVLLKVNIPANAIVGRYSVDVHLPNSKESLKSSNLIVIFNPWSEDDEVFLDSEKERNEYVLNETGILYQGSSTHGPHGIYAKRWNFGQFEKDILDCVLLLLNNDIRSKRNPLKYMAKRSSALWISRMLSAMVNSNNDYGVIRGNWSGEYDGGVSPSSWSGSVAILHQYYHTLKPVNYGQCWVYAGVLATALRAIGIPARAVTNFDSAHDSDQSMTIDDFFDEDGNEATYQDSRDSIWNFHVWNEMWCSRRDLSDGKYDGWQVVDATPQEHSFRLFQLGPAPVKAVKEGEIYAGWDTGFVFAEVNADYVRWAVVTNGDEQSLQPSYTHSSYVGTYISTKEVGTDEREDITRQYKYQEGTEEERKAFKNAYTFGSGRFDWQKHYIVENQGTDVIIDLNTKPTGTIQNGENITGLIDVKNTSERRITVNVKTVLNSILYTGEVKHLIKQNKFENFSIDAGESAHFEVPVEALEYVGKLTDLNTMSFSVVVKVLETNKLYVDALNFQLENKDRINVQFVGGQLKVGKTSEVLVTFHNNLPITLHNMAVTIEGAGLTRPETKQQFAELGSNDSMTTTFSITPYKSGPRTLILDVDSNEVKDFKSYVNVDVLDDVRIHA